MATAKKRVDQVAWQIEVSTDEEWDDLIKNTGLIVVDVYSEWCGSCTAMASHLKEIKLQLGDDLLHCALAKSDNITQLEKFRCHSEPTFVFIAGGEPVALIRGANAPLIRKTLITELENEKEVLNGKRKRIALDWAAFEFSVDEPEEEEEPSATEDQSEESTMAPQNWIELDALILEGPYESVIDRFTQQLNEERPQVTVEAKTAGQIEDRQCFVLWLRQQSDRPVEEEVVDNEEQPNDEDFVTWIKSTITSIIAQLSTEEEVTQQQESNGPDGQINDSEVATRELEPPQGDEAEEPHDAAEVSDKEPIQFRFLTDPADKEELVQQLQSTTNEQKLEQEFSSTEKVASSVTPANNELEAPLAVD